MGNATSVSRLRGRPRDPAVEGKVFAAAAQVYGRSGWAGFTFDAVAREASVGKSTLYARWGDAEALLGDLIQKRWQAIQDIDTGHLESDLFAFAAFINERFQETGGGIAWHLRRDIGTHPTLATRVGDVMNHNSQMCVDILRRARNRGELREGVSLSLATELLISALESHALRNSQTAAGNDGSDHIRRIIDLLRYGIERPKELA